MENTCKLWVFYYEIKGKATIVAAKRCKRPSRTKIWKSLPEVAHEAKSTVYGYSLIDCPIDTQFVSNVLGDIRCFKFASTAWGNKLSIYHNGMWEFCGYHLDQYIFV